MYNAVIKCLIKSKVKKKKMKNSTCKEQFVPHLISESRKCYNVCIFIYIELEFKTRKPVEDQSVVRLERMRVVSNNK